MQHEAYVKAFGVFSQCPHISWIHVLHISRMVGDCQAVSSLVHVEIARAGSCQM